VVIVHLIPVGDKLIPVFVSAVTHFHFLCCCRSSTHSH